MKTSPEKISLIAADMDGTLLSPDGWITQPTLDAIALAQAKGIIFAICTGRFFENASILLKDTGLSCPIIAFNGGLIARAPFGRVVASHKMDSHAAAATFERLEKFDASYYVFGDGFVATRKEDDRHHSLIYFGERMTTEANILYTYGKAACLDAISQGIYKFYVHTDNDASHLMTVRHGLRDLEGVELTQSSDTNIEIMPPHIDKGRGVKDMAAHFGIPMSEVMAIGDQDNDLPMIRAAGWGVAMDNATAEVKAEADAVTASNAQDGVAQAIRRYALASSGQA